MLASWLARWHHGGLVGLIFLQGRFQEEWQSPDLRLACLSLLCLSAKKPPYRGALHPCESVKCLPPPSLYAYRESGGRGAELRRPQLNCVIYGHVFNMSLVIVGTSMGRDSLSWNSVHRNAKDSCLHAWEIPIVGNLTVETRVLDSRGPPVRLFLAILHRFD